MGYSRAEPGKLHGARKPKRSLMESGDTQKVPPALSVGGKVDSRPPPTPPPPPGA